MSQILEVSIEQHLCKTIKVEVPDGADLSSEEVMEAEQKVYDDFHNNKIILTSDDFNGVTLTSSRLEGGDATEWVDL